ncbi:serine/threonine-protein kinase LATS1-like isoform X2 [Tubulanus polymorphus]|uniref:serine/threonine-protein kinase LATS1-like isoform X2 n=1 Tax=Tubulanus polymorphus TaxID=672921 RepID=UPI003DA3C200
MIRKEGERGRRPLLSTFVGNNRQMLQEIRDSLSHHLRRAEQQPLRPELSQSSPNLVDNELSTGAAASPGNNNNAGGQQNANKMTRLGYHQKALAEIRKSLKPFATGDSENEQLAANVIHLGMDSLSVNQSMLQQMVSMGYDEDIACKALKISGSKSIDDALEVIRRICEQQGKNGLLRTSVATSNSSGLSRYNTKVMRKPSFEEKYRQSESSRSESPASESVRSSLLESPQTPPPVPPRQGGSRGQTPPPTIPKPVIDFSVVSQRGVSPVSYSGRPFVSQVTPIYTQNAANGHQVSQQKIPVKYSNPPSYMQLQHQQQHQQRFSTVVHRLSTPDAGLPSPGSDASNFSNNGVRPKPMQAWGAKQQPIIMQSVKSREVPKPVLQTATAPVVPPNVKKRTTADYNPGGFDTTSYTTSIHAQVNTPQQTLLTQAPSFHGAANQIMPSVYSTAAAHANAMQAQGNVQIQISHIPTTQRYATAATNHSQQAVGKSGPRTIQIQIQNQPRAPPSSNWVNLHNYPDQLNPGVVLPSEMSTLRSYLPVERTALGDAASSRSDSPVSRTTNQSPVSVTSTQSTPSTNSDLLEKPPPPPPYPSGAGGSSNNNNKLPPPIPLRPTHTNVHISSVQASAQMEASDGDEADTDEDKQRCTSPIPEYHEDRNYDKLVRVKNYSPHAFKFYMEQHVENVLKSHHQRINRRVQLENEMAKVGLSCEAQSQMRKMLHQKESNYIRLKRAKMNKSMFDAIKTVGTGAFGKVQLVRKKDTGHLYAMKTLRKSDVLKRNQVAHVKAERDILAEADNEWVVKLYYSFQDTDYLYFVMDYIPGGDMMNLLIKFGIFHESLARFYVAELVLAIESVHKLGFIHRDIKPDNILIDRDGHIRLTDFGLCTGFRWTHNSKYYQTDGHQPQDSMDVSDTYGEKEILKPLQRRKQQEQRIYGLL